MKQKKNLSIISNSSSKSRIIHESRKYKYIECETCKRSLEVDENSIGGMCWKCTAKLVGLPEIKSYTEKSKFPPGWRFMSLFVDYEGNVYKYGEIDESLKGTMEPTDVDKIKAEMKLKRLETKKRRLQREEKLKEKENKLREKAKKQEKKIKEKNTKIKRKR